MKIYTSIVNTRRYDLSKYLGKDVWIKVKVKSNRSSTDYWEGYWIKLYDVKSGSLNSWGDFYYFYKVNTFPMGQLSYCPYPDYDVFVSSIQKGSTYADKIQICRPVELLTTEELFDSVKEDPLLETEQQISPYVGSNKWLLGWARGDCYWIKFLSEDLDPTLGPHYKCKLISCDNVELHNSQFIDTDYYLVFNHFSVDFPAETRTDDTLFKSDED